MLDKVVAALTLCIGAGSQVQHPINHNIISNSKDGGIAMVDDEGQNNTQHQYRAPGDDSVIQQHLGPKSGNSHQSAVSSAPGRLPNTIIQNSDGGSGNNQTATIIGGGGNVVSQTQTGSGNRQVVTQTGSGNRATQLQHGSGHESVLNQNGRQNDTVIQE